MALRIIKKDEPLKVPSAPLRKFKRLQDLPSEKYLELENMLMTGEPVSEVARYVKGWGFFDDLKDSSLYQLLGRFKTDVIQPKIVMNQEGLLRSSKAKALKRATEVIDLAAEFAALITLQKGRVEKMVDREQDLPVVLDTVSREIRLLHDILKGLSTVKLESGMARKVESGDALANVNVLNVQTYDDSFGREAAQATLNILGELVELGEGGS